MAEIRGIEQVAAALRRLQTTTGANVRRALSHCGKIAMSEAKANAPRSPTMKQLSATLKKKKRTARRTLPGGLEYSIKNAVAADGMSVSVFVSSNSPAGKYAKRIHDEKGKTWRNRGPGTVAKGPRADEKFVERAVRDNADRFRAIIEDEIRKAVASA